MKINKLKIFLFFFALFIFCGCNENYSKNAVSESVDYYNFDDYTVSEEVTFDNEHQYLNEIFQDAKKGDIYSINYISKLYYNGDIVEKDYKKAFKWIKKGADLGNASSQYNLGWLYEKGEGVNADLDKALEFYSMSAKQNYPEGICALAYMNYNGYGKEKNYDEAYKLFLKAAGGLNSGAMSNIGDMYMDGAGLQKNTDMAYLWYKISADNDVGNHNSDLLIKNKDYNPIRNLIKDFSNFSTIPNELIIEAQEYILSSQPYHFLKKYSAQSNIYFDEIKNSGLKFTKEFEDAVIKGQRDKWYCEDINNDGKNELIFFTLEGSLGISVFEVFTQNQNGEFDISKDMFKVRLWYGVNDIIKYKNKYYFVIVSQDYSFHYPSYMKIYSFDGINLSECVTIENEIDLKNMNFIKTYQFQNYPQIKSFVDSQINNIMEYAINKQNVYVGDEHKLNEAELKDIDFSIDNFDNIYSADINNDGIDECFYKSIWFPSSVNSQNHLMFSLYQKFGGQYKEISDVKDYINDEYILGYLQQLFIKKFENENYIFMLSQKENSKNFNLCIYKLNGENSRLVMSYLITFPFGDIQMDVKNASEDFFDLD